MKIILTGEPRSTNNVYKYHCKFGFPSGYLSKEGKALKEDYIWQAKQAMIKNRKKMTTSPVEIDIKLFFGTKRIHDIDNYGKILLDSLTGIVWKDDSQIQRMTVSKMTDGDIPRIELEISL